jgi:DNA-binding transcriptional LysR family regulator
MQRETISDLVAFLAVAREASFTRAAVKLGLSQSALSHIIRGLESRMGLRLLARTTRSVAPTAAGARLLETLGPRLDEIDAELLALSALRDTPAGTIRLTCGDNAADTVILPQLPGFLTAYPLIKVEIAIDYGLTDIVAAGFDAGIRMGEQVAKDMIAVPVGPPLRMAVVGAWSYFAGHPAPIIPQDLTDHACINLRLQTQGGLYAWEFAKDGRDLRVKVDGQIICNRSPQMRLAALMGLGLAYVPLDSVADDLAAGRLQQVLADWCHPFSGYHLYYPNRRQPSAAFARLVETLRA